MLETYHKADSKNKVLSAWTKESVEQITRVSSTWDNYMSLMDNHEMIISKQVDAIKANLNTQVSDKLSEKLFGLSVIGMMDLIEKMLMIL